LKKSKVDKKVYDICQNNAPYFAYQIQGKKWGIVQGCCNDWNCPRCGQQLAREHYGRIVHGAREIAKENQLYFLTITCRGSDCTLAEAEANYLIWTNSLLTNIRTSCKRAGKKWAYAAVTERQERLHPHSHYITTYCPDDALPIKEGEPKHYITSGEVFPAKHDTLQSYKLERACVGCGLGRQYDISRVSNFEAGSRYMAKYLFKESIFQTVWPAKWRRVRYSQSWPKLPNVKGEAIILLTTFDWYKLSQYAAIVLTKDDGAKKYAQAHMSNSDTIIQ
jgi:hypothetical protein